jgi:antitoxin ChpS
MRATLRTRRVGGSLMLPLPAELVKRLGLKPGQNIPATVADGKLILEPAKPRTLADLLAMCDFDAPPDPFEQQWMDLPPVGREIME